MPYDWAEVITKTRAIVSSPHFDLLTLQEIKLSFEYWCSEEFKCIRSFIESNWSLIDIFGCNGSAPTKVHAQKGLLLLFEPSFKIEKISRQTIEYGSKLRTKFNYYAIRVSKTDMKLISEL